MRALCIGVMLLSGCAATWQRYESTHAILVTDLPENRARSLLTHVERFRAAATEAFNLASSREAHAKYTFTVFANNRDFIDMTGFDPKEAVFVTRDHGGHVLLTDADDFSAINLALTRDIVQTSQAAAYPHWYEMGLSYYLSTAKLEESRMITGEPTMLLTTELLMNVPRWFSMREVLSLSSMGVERERRTLLSAQRWIVVHYLTSSQDNAFRLDLYLKELERSDHATAFERAIGVSPAEFDQEVRQYARRDKVPILAISVGDLPSEVAIETHRLAPEYGAALGYMSVASALELQDSVLDDARRDLERAAKSSNRAEQALSGLVRIARQERDFDRAARLIGEWQERFPDSARGYAEEARLILAKHDSLDSLSSEALARMVEAADIALEKDPHSVSALRVRILADLHPERTATDASYALTKRALARVPAHDQLHSIEVEVLIKLERYTEAMERARHYKERSRRRNEFERFEELQRTIRERSPNSI